MHAMRPAMAPERQISPERIPDFSTVFTVPIHRTEAPCMGGGNAPDESSRYNYSDDEGMHLMRYL